MPPRGSKAPAKPTSKLIAHNFLPTLTKPQEVVGSFVVMPGREWAGCPSADKEKLFKCVVPKFVQAWEAAGCRLDADLGLVVINDGGGGGTSDSHTVMPAATD